MPVGFEASGWAKVLEGKRAAYVVDWGCRIRYLSSHRFPQFNPPSSSPHTALLRRNWALVMQSFRAVQLFLGFMFRSWSSHTPILPFFIFKPSLLSRHSPMSNWDNDLRNNHDCVVFAILRPKSHIQDSEVCTSICSLVPQTSLENLFSLIWLAPDQAF
jgi:hypothetical protein